MNYILESKSNVCVLLILSLFHKNKSYVFAKRHFKSLLKLVGFAATWSLEKEEKSQRRTTTCKLMSGWVCLFLKESYPMTELFSVNREKKIRL